MQFTAQGHRNISARHKTTLEFTKDDYVTPTGDCIVGINADFKVPKQDLGRIRIIIECDGHREEIVALHNPGFDSHEMVIRKSDFLDKRTFAIKADKAACDLGRQMVGCMARGCSISIKITTIQ